MSDFLDQAAIDALQEKLSSFTSLTKEANSAKEKLAIIHYDICKKPLKNNSLDSLELIGDYINLIEKAIKPDYKYSDDFYRLRNSYLKRLAK